MSFQSIRIFIALACLIASPVTFAQAINITVSGEIKEVSCTPTLSGPRVSGNTIDLEPADITDFPALGSTAKPTEITFALVGCGMSAAKNNMWVHFSSPNNAGGIMLPTSGSPRTGFEIMDVNSAGVMGSRVHVGGPEGDQPTSNQGTAAAFTGTFPSRDATKKYVIRYRRYSSLDVVPGAISTPATYIVKYY